MMCIKPRWIFALLTVMLSALFFIRAGVFLSSPAGEPQQADAIVILGGGYEARSLRGLELYRKKFAPVVLLTGMEEGNPFAQKYSLNWQVRMLMAGGVRKEDIEFDAASRNSWQEAENTLKLAKARGWRKVIVVSEPPHMRRLKWAWGKVLRGSGIDFVLVSSAPSCWHAEKWWADKSSKEFVENEYVKLVYYFFKY